MAHPLCHHCLDFTIHAEAEATAHPLGRHCLDLTIHAEAEATAHPLGRHCLDLTIHAEAEATARPLGRHCLANGRPAAIASPGHRPPGRAAGLDRLVKVVLAER
jgi:hypothetical protein